MAAKIKSGDLVKVIRGKDRGKEGTVKQVLSNDRLIVEGVQIVKKHVRATQQGQQAGIVSTEAPIHRSNVMVIDPETKQPTRVGITVKEEARDGKVKTVRVRVAGRYRIQGEVIMAEERNFRKVRRGYVVSDKMDKTITVELEQRSTHPLYGKVVRSTSKVKAHDEHNDAHIGDLVSIMETRPLSKTKRWRLESIIERAK